MQNVLKRISMYLEGFHVILNFLSRIVLFKTILNLLLCTSNNNKKTSIFFGIRKKTSFRSTGGGGLSILFLNFWFFPCAG